jgi:hypothetical protein
MKLSGLSASHVKTAIQVGLLAQLCGTTPMLSNRQTVKAALRRDY